MRRLLLLAPLPLSACAFVPDSLLLHEHDLTSDVRRLGCLEVSLGDVRDPQVQFDFGNRCHWPVGVDFRNLEVTAWSFGEAGPLDVSDPRGELHEAVIDAHGHASVVLDYPASLHVSRFCVDVARLDVDDPSPAPVPVCFENTGDLWLSERQP